MLRQVGGRRALSMWPRKAVAAVASGDQVTIHKVKFRSRRDHFRKFFIYTTAGMFCWYTWATIVSLPFRNLDTKGLPEIEDDEEFEPLFIPFPFTTKKVQPPPYAGREKEWQSFIAFSNDREHRDRAKLDLAMLVKKTAENNSTIKRWAKTDLQLTLGSSWLVITYPERPPPEFVRTGIEISDEEIAIKTQKVDTRTKTLIDRALKPYPLAMSSYAFIKVFFKQSTSDVAKLFGYSENNDISALNPNPDITKSLKRLEARQMTDGGAATNPSSASGSPSSKTDPAASSRKSTMPDSTPAQTPTAASDQNQSGQEQGKKSIVKESIPGFTALVNKSQEPWAAFAQQWRQTWRPLKYYPPRGSLAIHGMVALESPKGRIYIDVTAWYHPIKKEFHQESMQLGLKAISPATQIPRR